MLATGDVQQVDIQQVDIQQVGPVTASQRQTVVDSDVNLSTMVSRFDDNDVEIVEVRDAANMDDVVLDLSTKESRRPGVPQPEPCQQQQRGPPGAAVSTSAGQWQLYQRHLDDLQRLDELIRRRTYERNVLTWRRDQTRRSLERLLQPVRTAANWTFRFLDYSTFPSPYSVKTQAPSF